MTENMTIVEARAMLRTYANEAMAHSHHYYFKDEDRNSFLGVPAADIKRIAKEFQNLPLNSVQILMKSIIYDERVLANVILVRKYQKGDQKEQKKIVLFYLKNIKYIHDWANVDNSAPYILGDYLLTNNRDILYSLILSPRLWDRRIAIVSTWILIRNGQFQDTIKLAEISLNDKEDLIHKANGWMLRELGKRNTTILEDFLNLHAKVMPRTMLRYAIERFSSEKKQYYLKQKIKSY